MEIEFLGTGTSTGVPQIGCECEVCKSKDTHDKRLRTSAIVRTKGKNILIDCGPDFRQQILSASSPKIDTALLTHCHYDHIGGIDDLRPYCSNGPFPMYAQENVIEAVKNWFPYCFVENPYPGVPSFDMRIADENHPINFEGIEITPIPIMHYKLEINGYRIGDFAYITDAKTISPNSMQKLKGVKYLVINALRIEPHMSHMSLSETLNVVEEIAPEQTYLIHMSHQIGFHAEVSKTLPKNVYLAYDGLLVNF